MKMSSITPTSQLKMIKLFHLRRLLAQMQGEPISKCSPDTAGSVKKSKEVAMGSFTQLIGKRPDNGFVRLRMYSGLPYRYDKGFLAVSFVSDGRDADGRYTWKVLIEYQSIWGHAMWSQSSSGENVLHATGDPGFGAVARAVEFDGDGKPIRALVDLVPSAKIQEAS